AATVAAAAGATASALSIAATLATPRGTVGGNATKFKIDKDAGIPIVFGRTYVGGNVIHRQYYDDPGSRMKNQRESWVTVLSLGPVKSIGPLLIDKKPVYFTGAGAAMGDFAGNTWLDTQLGACPEPRALQGPTGPFPGWNGTSKLSGKAADLWTLDFDSKGKKFPTGVPQRGRVVEGRFAYDPRLDSTYPGGSGPCRVDDPTTHVYTENPWLQAITFAYGYYQNGHLVAGGGLAITGIELAPFVQAANTADLNNWVAGGVVYTTADDDWDIMKMLAQAGGGDVYSVGGLLTCTHAAPRVSIGTITSDDIIGDVVAPSTASMRVRRNAIIPRVRLEEQGWEVVPLTSVTVPEYAVIDRATRPKETEYPLIQSAKQAGQIAMYEMLDSRELEPISLPCKLPLIGFRPGDCVTLDIPEANLVGRDVVLRERELDMATFGVTFVARSEDPAKHPFALGTSPTPPRTPDLSVPSLDLDPPVGWAAVATMVPSPTVPLPAIVVSGLVDNGGAEAVQFDYRPDGSTEWLSGGTTGVDVTRIEITSVVAEATYYVSVRYRVRGQLGDRLILGPVTIPHQAIAVDYDDITGDKPEPGATKGMTAEEREKYEGIAKDIENIFSDGILHRGPEKLTLLRIYDDVVADSFAAHAQSLALKVQYGGDPTANERAARDTAFSALVTYLASLNPPWDQVDVDTPADGNVIRDKFGAERQATANLARANEAFIAARAKAALDQLVAIGSDSVLSRGEKQEAQVAWANIYNESAALKARYIALGTPFVVKATIDAQVAAVDALATYLGGLNPQWFDATQDTPIVAATWQSTWAAAYQGLSASRSALYAYTATTAQWDGVGNKPYSRLFTNMLDLQPFVPGAVDTFGRFAQNGANGQNAVVLTSGPSGVSEPILRMVATAGEPSGGWNYTLFADRGEYDPRKTYRFMNWAFQSPGADGAVWLGTGPVVDLLDGTPNGNFYFWNGALPKQGKWFLIVGVLHGSDYRGGQSGVSGVYDPDTGRRVLAGSDCRSRTDATTLLHRAYQFYSSPGSTAWFARPSVEEVTSATVSVEQIFATVGMTTVQAAALAEAQNELSAIGSDAVLSKGEKDRVTREYLALGADVDALYNKFVALGQPSDVFTPINDAVAARNNLGNYLIALVPSYVDTTKDTPIDPPTWANRWDVAYDRLARANAAITGRKGDPGDKGDKGNPGDKGDKGDAGSPGPKGR
ncbi:hypothetical protein DMC47_21380, partial [Nostoc sp. 3335mG]